jgi:ATP synthase protein I
LSKSILSKIRSLAFSYIYIQIIVILCVTGFLSLFGKGIIAYSFLWGGCICILPTAYFARKLFAKTGAKATREIITAFYVGEIVKFIITIILFAITFKYFNVNKLALFIGYLVAQFAFWFTALIRDPTVNKL